MIRILLVEDDPVIRDTTSYFLNCQQEILRWSALTPAAKR